MLSQLSYTPESAATDRATVGLTARMARQSGDLDIAEVGVPELESGTSSLSATRSNQLSYTPAWTLNQAPQRIAAPGFYEKKSA